MPHSVPAHQDFTREPTLDRDALVERYQRTRARSKEIFGVLTDEAYYAQPIALRHPVVFYDGHLPAFSFNTLVKRALGGRSIDQPLERLFARGIDPELSSAASATSERHQATWPGRRAVRAFIEEADARVVDALRHADLDRPGDPLLDRHEVVHAILEHEAMHQETLLYMWHRLPFDQKRQPAGYRPVVDAEAPHQAWIQVPAGRSVLGIDRAASPFGWDNEHPAWSVDVPAFTLQRHNVTNEAFLEFVEAGGYREPGWWAPEDWAWIQSELRTCPSFWERQADRWCWRGMFAPIALPRAWPVYVSQAEAAAYARWLGARLPTEAEFQRAAYGTPEGHERPYPWGHEPPLPMHGVFDFDTWDPQPAGTRPAGRSAWGIDDLVGNGWEWTSSPFAPFPGFQPMASYPEYSAEFFDGQHVVLKGASPATAAELLRPTFRNWFRPRYPYVYATFRCARSM